MTVRLRSRLDLGLMFVWLALMVFAIVHGWPVGVVAFFAFAAGERWSAWWYR